MITMVQKQMVGSQEAPYTSSGLTPRKFQGMQNHQGKTSFYIK